MKLGLNDQRHLDAAEGWLELGNYLEANEELEQITPTMRAHPLVLRVRWGIYAKAEKWEMAAEVARAIAEMLPSNSWGWLQWAFSLHEMDRTEEAHGVLLPIADKFPDESMIPYNLACYCCRIGKKAEAWRWLERAIDLEGKKEIRLIALNDPDLEPMWADISEI